MTLEVTPELEARLQARAAAVGVPVDAYAIEVLQRDVAPRDVQREEAPLTPQQQAVRRARGLLAHLPDAPPIAFSSEREARNAQIRALLHAPAEVRAATLAEGARVMAKEYRDNPELLEFTHALQGEDFHDD